MKENFRFEKQGLTTWMAKNDDAECIPGLGERCTVENMQAFLDARVSGCKVTKAEVIESGIFEAPFQKWVMDTPQIAFVNPDKLDHFPLDMHVPFAYVEVMHETLAGDERIGFMIPTVWNGRFFGLGGGGAFTDVLWETCLTPDFVGTQRQISPVEALVNGFATAWTNSALPDEKMIWNPSDENGAFNEAMMRNYDVLGAHMRNVIGKALVEALTGQKPSYSYSEAVSGGGRLNIRLAQRFPEDVDGIWAEAPFFPYHVCAASIVWGMTALNTLGYLPYAKLDAFRDAVLDSVGGLDAWLELRDRVEFDACQCIGTKTEDGEITELDAKIMNMIWDGPKRADGTRIANGWRPGSKFWEKGWLSYIFDDDGNIIDIPDYPIVTTAYALWAARNPSYDWHTLTLDDYEAWYDEFYAGFSSLDVLDDDIDMRRLANAKTKLIIAAGTEDEFVPCDNTIGYFEDVVRATFKGDGDEARKNIRLFLTPGNDHIAPLIWDGIGPSIADSMTALMQWVEQDIAPDTLPGLHIDVAAGGVDKTGEIPVY